MSRAYAAFGQVPANFEDPQVNQAVFLDVSCILQGSSSRGFTSSFLGGLQFPGSCWRMSLESLCAISDTKGTRLEKLRSSQTSLGVRRGEILDPSPWMCGGRYSGETFPIPQQNGPADREGRSRDRWGLECQGNRGLSARCTWFEANCSMDQVAPNHLIEVWHG